MLLEKKVSGTHVTAIRLQDFSERYDIVYLQVQELSGNKIYTLSWNIDYDGEFW
jgi:hypothetical protein